MRTLPARWQRLSVLIQLTQSTTEEQWQAVASLPRLGTIVQIGRLYLKERALINRTLMRWIPGCPTHHVWQFFAAQALEQRYRTVVVWPRLSPLPLAIGAHVGLPFSSLSSFLSSSTYCFFVASGLPSLSLLAPAGVDVLGHHRAACSRAGVLGSRVRFHGSFVGAGRRQTSPAVCSRRGSPLRSPPTQAAHEPGTLTHGWWY